LVFTVDVVVDRVEAEEVRSAMEWAQVRALAADGVSKSEIAGFMVLSFSGPAGVACGSHHFRRVLERAAS
jgi:hypothetical protein